jgi:23S rRNA pseudouridine2605 synthase
MMTTMSGKSQHAGERIAKVMARAGLGSRREAEEWIVAGRVAVNGTAIASPALNVTSADRITVDGKPLPERERTRLFLYHKPRGLITTTADPEGRPTIFAALPKNLPRLVSVGRLDFTTEGLLLLTNDGGLARVLEVPETGWLRRYRVRAHGTVTQDRLDALRDGIEVGGIRYGSIEARLDRPQGSNIWLTFAMREGKNREIRNVLGALGLEVNRLIRISFGPFQLGELAENAVEEVKTRTLREQLGDKLAAQAGVDLAAPVIDRHAEEAPRPASGRNDKRLRDAPERPPRKTLGKGAHGRHDDKPRRRAGTDKRQQPRKSDDVRKGERPGFRKPGSQGHVWRDDDGPRHPRKGKHAPAMTDETPRKKRAGLLTDRRGRRVLVERIGQDSADGAAARPPGGKHPRKR